MRFLLPRLLPLVSLAAIPVIIHILSRLRLRRAQFPTLRLLQTVRRERFSWLRLRDLLLLLFRTATLCALLLALARPYCSPRGQHSLPARDLIILIDNSHSMAWGSTMERCRQAARRLIQGLGGGRRAALLVSADAGRSAGHEELTRNRQLLERLVDSLPVTASGTSLGPALQRALALARESQAAVAIISDCQERAFPQDLRIAGDIPVFLIDVGSENAPNATVSSVRIEPGFVTPSTPVRIRATFMNYSHQPTVRTAALLLGDSTESDRQTVTIPPHSRTDLTFGTLLTKPGQYAGAVALSADSLCLDDTFHFLFNLPERVPVLVLATEETPADYILNALGTDSLSLFDLTTVPLSQLSRQDLSRYRSLIATDASALSARDWDRLEFARRIGVASLLFCSGSNQQPGRLGTITLAGSRQLSGFVTIASFDSTTPFIGWLARSDLTAARFFRHAIISPGSASVLCRFSDNDPAMVAAADGQILIWAFAPLPQHTDLVYKAAFVPLLHSTLVTLTLGSTQTHYSAGDTVYIPAKSFGPQTLTTPSGSSTLTPEPAELPRLAVYETRVPGIYRFPAAPELSFAVNTDPAEADLTRVQQLPAGITRLSEELLPVARELSTLFLWLALAACAVELLLLAL